MDIVAQFLREVLDREIHDQVFRRAHESLGKILNADLSIRKPIVDPAEVHR
jgi:hypothetical protein